MGERPGFNPERPTDEALHLLSPLLDLLDTHGADLAINTITHDLLIDLRAELNALDLDPSKAVH